MKTLEIEHPSAKLKELFAKLQTDYDAWHATQFNGRPEIMVTVVLDGGGPLKGPVKTTEKIVIHIQ